jgi:hypothetical protein
MDTTTRSRVARSLYLSNWSRLGLILALSAGTALSVGDSAQATPAPRALTASICKNVSAASVSAIVGFAVPAPVFSTYKEPATKKNFEISGVSGVCTYGKETSLAAMKKAVTLDVEITSKPFTAAEAKSEIESVDAASKSLHFKMTPYSGLGTPAYYFSVSDAGFYGQGISSISGTTFFGASVNTKSVSLANVAALAKLAEKL